MIGLRTKILLGFGGLLAILLVSSGLASYVFARYTGAAQHMIRQDYDSVRAAQIMIEAMEQSDAAIRLSLLDSTVDVRKELAVRAADLLSGLQLQSASANDPDDVKLTPIIRQLWQEYQTALPEAIDTALPAERRKQWYIDHVKPPSDQIIADAKQSIELNLNTLTSREGAAHDLANRARFALNALTIVGIVIAATFSLTIGRLILRPLNALTESVLQIRSGNLDAAAPVLSNDELGRLAACFNEMAEQLRVFRKIDHERLLRTQRTTQLAIDSLSDPVVVLNPQGKIELTNEAGRKWFGLAPDMAVSQTPLPWLKTALARLSSSQPISDPLYSTGYDSAIRVESNGDERYLLPRGSPIVDEQHQVIGVTLVLNDVTGLRRLDQMKSGLLSLVSHELKTPLTSMRMILHLLASERIGVLAPEARDLLLTARDDSDRLHQIVENLLDMSRIESGKVLMEMQRIEIDPLLRRSVSPHQGVFAEQQVRLRMQPSERAVEVLADATRIGHVFANLLLNSLRYTPAGGEVSVGVHAGDEMVEFSVSDTGSGIPRQHLDRIFEKFFRVPGQQRGGAGLGLSIVKDIVEAHGGRVAVESEEGKGTTVRFTLRKAATIMSKDETRNPSSNNQFPMN